MNTHGARRICCFAILLALASLSACQSASTPADSGGAASPTRGSPTRSRPTGGSASIDRAYLLMLKQIDAEEKQAMEDARLKNLTPAEMVVVTESFENQRQRAKAQWQQARARAAAKGTGRQP